MHRCRTTKQAGCCQWKASIWEMREVYIEHWCRGASWLRSKCKSLLHLRRLKLAVCIKETMCVEKSTGDPWKYFGSGFAMGTGKTWLNSCPHSSHTQPHVVACFCRRVPESMTKFLNWMSQRRPNRRLSALSSLSLYLHLRPTLHLSSDMHATEDTRWIKLCLFNEPITVSLLQ